MDAGVASGTLHSAPDPGPNYARVLLSRAPAKCRPPFGLRRRGAICGVIAPR